ncbi:hypothetical protein GA0070624_3896 [Micromonospora rhizosphaerae]|uniref:Uncharacterized protein n=1 Tax=Micromonospora rhizosphaerae TaxID=568872 RepID=A0A1C6SJ98_9ACTN|nr:hypothetical protein [Micromonospora rhizosphaerae]SCL29513.1 hypothetical protein GA0070624_3896 [Micromonospora rhizosphaerae]
MASSAASRKGWAFIDFPIDRGLAFLTTVARSGPRDSFFPTTSVRFSAGSTSTRPDASSRRRPQTRYDKLAVRYQATLHITAIDEWL